MTNNGHEMLRLAVGQFPEGVILVDSNDEVVFVNKAAEEIRRVKAADILGRSVLLCHPPKSLDRVQRALEFLRKENTKGFTRMVTDTVQDRIYENTYTPLKDSNGNYAGAVVISRDITEKRRLEEERAGHQAGLEERIAELEGKLQDLFIASITSLANTLEAKDPYTKGHSIRVSNMATKLAEQRYGVSKESKQAGLAGQLHDIGKIGTREAVLHKPGRLTEEEFNHIKEHSVIGERILTPVERLKPIAPIVRHHHERFDGRGYPDDLKGEAIPQISRILALADSYDAMTSSRPYRPPMPPEQVAEEIKKNLGSQFDPELGKVFLELFYSGSIG